MTIYHIVVEATLAQPGQHFIARYLDERDLLPGFRAGMATSRSTSSATSASASSCCPTCARGPASARRRRRPAARGPALPLAVLVPPGWDRSYTEVFGFTLEEIYAGGRALVRDQAARRRPPARLAARARRSSRFDLPRPSARRHGLALLQAGVLGEKTAPPPRDPETMALLFDSCAARLDHRTAPAGPFTVQWEFADAEPWHLRVDNGSTRGRGRAARRTSTSRSAAATRTGSTSSPAASTRRGALATGRLRPRGDAARPVAARADLLGGYAVDTRR